jgi:hypothetical protein
MKFGIAFLSGLMLLFSITLIAANDDEKTGPMLKFTNNNHDYGTVYVDSMPDTNLDIAFSNQGDEPLILSNVRGCCGTRITQWPREPILPGEDGTISIKLSLAARPQRISKTVTVTYNNEAEPVVRYRVVGQVVERE